MRARPDAAKGEWIYAKNYGEIRRNSGWPPQTVDEAARFLGAYVAVLLRENFSWKPL